MQLLTQLNDERMKDEEAKRFLKLQNTVVVLKILHVHCSWNVRYSRSILKHDRFNKKNERE